MAVEHGGQDSESREKMWKSPEASTHKEHFTKGEPSRESTPEERDAALAEQRKIIDDSWKKDEPTDVGRKVDTSILGDFSPGDVRHGRIVLNEETRTAVEEQVRKLKKSAGYFKPLANGTPIDAAYDIRVNNFSTHTKIIVLPDGRRMFAVFAHEGSRIHRAIDGFVKHATGLRMGKVARDDWKPAFEEHARIPLAKTDDPYTVLMPYVPNVNAYDAIANNKKIKDFGEITWAKDITPEMKLELLKNIMAEVQDIHESGIAWGECILQNLILTESQRAIMCDPEVRYDEDVPLKEAQARDLKDLLLSSCTALRKSEGAVDIKGTVHAMLDGYKDDKVLKELRKICKIEFSLGLAVTFWNEKLRTGVESREEYNAILTAAREYKR